MAAGVGDVQYRAVPIFGGGAPQFNWGRAPLCVTLFGVTHVVHGVLGAAAHARASAESPDLALKNSLMQ